MNFYIYKFSFLSSNRKVCPSKIGFSVTGQETEFAGDENSWFSHEKSSLAPKEDASHFIVFIFGYMFDSRNQYFYFHLRLVS